MAVILPGSQYRIMKRALRSSGLSDYAAAVLLNQIKATWDGKIDTAKQHVAAHADDLKYWKNCGTVTERKLAEWAGVPSVPAKEPPTCETCRFWDWDWYSKTVGHEDEEYPDEGFCRRYPPVFRAANNRNINTDWRQIDWAFPVVVRYDWCGEHQPKPPAP